MQADVGIDIFNEQRNFANVQSLDVEMHIVIRMYHVIADDVGMCRDLLPVAAIQRRL